MLFGWTSQKNVYVPGLVNVNSAGPCAVPISLSIDQFELVDFTLCGNVA
jgi:hypothetical protein